MSGKKDLLQDRNIPEKATKRAEENLSTPANIWQKP
jgi:hypothetical protein